MQRFIATIAACTLLLHLLLGCCWHHEQCRCAHEADRSSHTAHGTHQHAHTHLHDELPPPPEKSHHGCEQGRCWWLADHDSPQPPLLVRLADQLIAADPISPTAFCHQAADRHLSHWQGVTPLPVRAHLWNQLLLI